MYGRKFTVVTDYKPLVWFQNSKDPCSRVSRWRLKLAEYDFDVIYKAGNMNVNAEALSRNPIDDSQEKSKYLQVDDNDTFMTSQEKMFSKRTFTRNKQENSENELKPSKRRDLNPGIVPDDVHHFSEIPEAQLLKIDSKIPEYFQELLCEELFSEIGKNILKYTDLLKNMASRLIFITIFLLSPMFSKKYKNLSWKTITTRAQKRIEQEKAKNLNRNETQEKLDENFSSKPLMKKPRGRPKKNLLTNLKNIPSQTKRKRGRPRKQIYENELPEINMQKESRSK